MAKGEITLEQFKAMFKLVSDAQMTDEERRDAIAGLSNMSDWQAMSMSELDKVIEAEEQARRDAAKERE